MDSRKQSPCSWRSFSDESLYGVGEDNGQRSGGQASASQILVWHVRPTASEGGLLSCMTKGTVWLKEITSKLCH
jgi:hypothetical protein